MGKFCTNCGLELKIDQKFCNECGTKVMANEKPFQGNETDSKTVNENIYLSPPIVEKKGSNSEFKDEKSGTFTNECDLYQNGMDIIISSSILFSMPFMEAGKQITDQFELLKTETAQSLTSDLIKNIPLDQFLSEFYKYSNAFVERVTQYFSDMIRKHTQRNDIKQKTSESISDEIRKESFKKFDEVFSNYIVTMQGLGVQLDSISSIKSAVQGTFLGGGLQLMGSKGKSSGAGMVAGALIGAAIAEGEKIELRKQLLKASFDGIKEIIETLPICNQKLMDQYSSYIFGSNIDFSERDKQINRGKNILSDIKSHCLVILDKIVLGNTFWNDAIIDIARAQQGVKFVKIYSLGCIGNTLLFFIIAGAIGGFKLGSSPFESALDAIVFSFLVIFPFLYYAYYNYFLKKKNTDKQKEKILATIETKRASYQQLENSLIKLNEYKNYISFKFKE